MFRIKRRTWITFGLLGQALIQGVIVAVILRDAVGVVAVFPACAALAVAHQLWCPACARHERGIAHD